MTKILIPYGTSEGHTARIAGCIADAIRGEGYEAFPLEIKRSGAPAPEGYDAVIVGASVHAGRHQTGVRKFARKHRAALERVPSAFFSVSLAAADSISKGSEEANGYIEQFVRQTGWRPGKVGRFAGALLYTRYGFVMRWLMKRITIAKGSPDTDTSRDYVYTDWDRVRRFAREFLERSFPKTFEVTSGSGI
jgi:menaquinone-dependent protoporphyrinogen oxidase